MKTLGTIVTIVLIIWAILAYPLFVEVRNGEVICSNILGQRTSCD